MESTEVLVDTAVFIWRQFLAVPWKSPWMCWVWALALLECLISPLALLAFVPYLYNRGLADYSWLTNNYNQILTQQMFVEHQLCAKCMDLVWECSVVSDSLWPHELPPARLLCPWDFPGENTGMDCHFLLQRIFPTQGLNPHLWHRLHWQVDSLPPRKPKCIGYTVEW